MCAFVPLLNTPFVVSDLVLLGSLAARSTNRGQASAVKGKHQTPRFAMQIFTAGSSGVTVKDTHNQQDVIKIGFTFIFFESPLLAFQSRVSNCHLGGSDLADNHTWLKFNCSDEISIDLHN